MENSKQPAMPFVAQEFSNSVSSLTPENYYGLTKREYFAGLMAQSLITKYPTGTDYYKSCAKQAVELADELLKQLEG